MKPVTSILCLLFLMGVCNHTFGQKLGIFKHARKKAETEVNKKVDKTIEGVINPEDKSPSPTENHEEPKPEEKDAPNQSPSPEDPNLTEDPSSPTSKKSGNAGKIEEPRNTPVLNMVKNDFVPGEKVIFEDDLYFEQMGEFPSRWDLIRGTVENASIDGGHVIAFASSAEIKPLMKTDTYLPETFTIEFECYFYLKGNEGYTLNFDKGDDVRINHNNAQCKGTTSHAKSVASKPGWRKVALSFNQRALKVYLNGERVLNIPNIKENPTKVHFSALSHSGPKGNPAAIRNIRIAEGGVKLYDRLLTDGKIITNDIHFDVNKATIKPESKKEIQRIVELMTTHHLIRFNIGGHTDSDGQDQFNQQLSQDRAEAVRLAMIEMGIAPDRLISSGYGESQPLDVNSTEEGKARNRRVEFELIK